MRKLLKLVLLGVFFAQVLSTNAYWQQHLSYNIQVELNDSLNTLNGYETIVYQNNSPDTLDYILFHLWPNAYKSSETSLAKQLLEQGEDSWHFASDDQRGYVDSLFFKIDGKSIKEEYVKEYGKEVVKVPLPKVLLPGEKTVVSTPFVVKLPELPVSRLGVFDSIFTISQWYPKPAVYDKDGWHPMVYLDQGEFYSEFADFQVSIRLPSDYDVASCGKLIGGDKLVEEDWIKERNIDAQLFLDTMLGTESYPSIQRRDGQFSSSKKTLVYQLEGAHDFAFAASNRWMVLLDTLELNNREIPTRSYFVSENAKLWKEAPRFLRQSLTFYNREVGRYSYGTCVLADVNHNIQGGMEYPSLSLIGDVNKLFSLEQVIAHEVGHNWFYGSLASNEREHPWMDEGINSFYELRYIDQHHPELTLGQGLGVKASSVGVQLRVPFKRYYGLGYQYLLSRGTDQSVFHAADQYSLFDYGNLVYGKTAYLLDYFTNYLGEDEIANLFQNYFEEWSFKHPSADELAGDLSLDSNHQWLGKLLSSEGYLDYAIKRVEPGKVLLENKSTIEAPLALDFIRNDSVYRSVWLEGFSGLVYYTFQDSTFDRIEIDHSYLIPDADRSNNTYQNHSILPRVEKTRLKFLGALPEQQYNDVYWLPYLIYNEVDVVQLGSVFYNSLLERKKLSYFLMPNYGVLTGRFGGDFKLNYLNPEWFDSDRLKLFGAYRRLNLPTLEDKGFAEKGEIGVEFNKSLQGDWRTNLRFVQTRLSYPQARDAENSYLVFDSNWNTDHTLFPSSAVFSLQWINFSDVKLSAEFIQEFAVAENWNKLKLRFFGGAFLTQGTASLLHRFRLTSGTGTDGLFVSQGEVISAGMNDYLLDDYFFARYSGRGGIMSQQVYKEDGAFRTGLFLGANNNWLVSTNLTIPTPKSYLDLFADFGWYSGQTDLPYVAGIQLTIVEDVFEVYFPVLWSQSIEDNYNVQGSGYLSKVKFLLNISQFHRFY